MKTIYLYDKNWNKVKFEYSEILELKEELEKRNISIGDHANIGDGASIGNRVSIGDGVKLQKNFYIVDSKHILTYTGNNTLSIGCHNYTIKEWLDNFEIIGKKENYTQEQIKEYKQYILMAEQFAKIS